MLRREIAERRSQTTWFNQAIQLKNIIDRLAQILRAGGHELPGIRLERSQAKRHARRHYNFQMRKKQVGAQMYYFLSAPISSNEFDYVTFRRKAECVRSAVRCAPSKSSKIARIRTSEAKSARTEHRSERSERRSGAHNPEVMRWLAAPRSCATSSELGKILNIELDTPKGRPCRACAAIP